MEPLNRDFVTDDSAAVRELLEGLQQGDSSALDLLIGILYRGTPRDRPQPAPSLAWR